MGASHYLALISALYDAIVLHSAPHLPRMRGDEDLWGL